MPLLRRLLLSTAAMLVLGVAAGFVWLQLADPAQWEARADGVVLTEAASTGQFSVIVTFVVIGAVVGLVAGIFAARVLADLGWLLTPVVIAATVVMSVVAWRLGVWQGPPDPATVSGLSIGDRIPAELAVDGVPPFLAWPIFGLIGLIGTTWATRRDAE